jgi:hypothetical protein
MVVHHGGMTNHYTNNAPLTPVTDAILTRIRALMAQYEEGAIYNTECVVGIANAILNTPDWAPSLTDENFELRKYYAATAIVPR